MSCTTSYIRWWRSFIFKVCISLVQMILADISRKVISWRSRIVKGMVVLCALALVLLKLTGMAPQTTKHCNNWPVKNYINLISRNKHELALAYWQLEENKPNKAKCKWGHDKIFNKHTKEGEILWYTMLYVELWGQFLRIAQCKVDSFLRKQEHHFSGIEAII